MSAQLSPRLNENIPPSEDIDEKYNANYKLSGITKSVTVYTMVEDGYSPYIPGKFYQIKKVIDFTHIDYCKINSVMITGYSADACETNLDIFTKTDGWKSIHKMHNNDIKSNISDILLDDILNIVLEYTSPSISCNITKE